MIYDKLVRDRIPEIIKIKGKTPMYHIASDEEYKRKLGDKLLEEVRELFIEENIEELADVLEVVHAWCAHSGISMEEVESVRKKKADERGGFAQKIILEEVR